MRIVRLILLVLLTAHCVACGWQWITRSNPGAPNAVPPDAGLLKQYVSDLYYCTLLLQGQGEYRGTSVWQNVFSIFTVLLGSVILAIVFGNVAMLVANFNANSTTYQRKMEAVFATMNKLQLPHDLHERIHHYYEHLWQCCPFLQGAYAHAGARSGTLSVVLNLSARVYLPDDYIVRQGEVGGEMFMVNRGLCEIGGMTTHTDTATMPTSRSLHTDGMQGKNSLDDVSSANASHTRDQQYHVEPQQSRASTGVSGKQVGSGHTFGEMALLMNSVCSASVRAVTFVEMCVLERERFQRILARYPSDRRRVLRLLLVSSVERRELPIPWSDISTLILRRRVVSSDGTQSDSSAVTTDDIVDALLEMIDRPGADRTIWFRFQERGATGARPSHRSQYLRRRQSNRSSLGSSSTLTAVSEQNLEAMSSIHSESDSSSLDALLLRLDAQVQSIERVQIECIRLLKRFGLHDGEKESSGNMVGVSRRLTPKTKTSLQRRSSIGPTVLRSSAYSMPPSPTSSASSPSRFADELWKSSSRAHARVAPK